MDTKSALWGLFLQYLAPVIMTGIASLLGWASLKLGQWLHAKAGDAAATTATKKASLVAERFAYFANTVVQELEATVRPYLKEAAADGTISQDEAAKIKTLALEKLKALAGDKGIKEAQAVLGILAPGIDVWLGGLIEGAHSKLSEPEPTPVPP